MLENIPLQSGGIGGIILIVYLAVVVISIAGVWKTFTKAGQPGWAAIVPIYNFWVMVKVAGKEWYWFLLALIPLVNIIAFFVIFNGISKNFGQGIGFTLGLMFLSVIFFPLLGFGDYHYQASSGGGGARGGQGAPR